MGDSFDSITAVAEGWLLDVYERAGAMVLWFIADDGRRLRATEPFRPSMFIEGPPSQVAAVERALVQRRLAEPLGWTERLDFWSGAPHRVRELRILDTGRWRLALNAVGARHPEVQWYNADLLPEQHYCYTRDIFPLMRCRFSIRGGALVELEALDDRWAIDFESPPLRQAMLRAGGSLAGASAAHSAPGRRLHLAWLEYESDGRIVRWDSGDADTLASFQRHLDEDDPDVLLTFGGDAFAIPLLLSVAQRTRFPLRLDRDPLPTPRRIEVEGRTYMSYGNVLYSSPDYPLYGRLHIDAENSFMVSHAGLEGLGEVARLARIPVQRIGRRSIGTGITSVQLDDALRGGFLIPWKKTHPEAWKTAAQLLKTDRGGLVFSPDPGLYEDVVELDFISMYPTIMSRFNVSPETVNCSCCTGQDVPELGYTICKRRQGLVARVLGPVVDKRLRYKGARNEAKARGDAAAAHRLDSRQTALKWMLVCCFGYLGYRNARFGRIEAHEAVTAYSREKLLVAREVCEAAGWEILHSIVDCVWIRKKGFRDDELEPLQQAIGAATGLPIALEGIYNWIAFLPSKRADNIPVPTRYFGAFRDTSVKFRGIECRRHDLPVFIRREQERLLRELARRAPNAAAYRAAAPWLEAEAAELERQLREGEVPLDDLLIRQVLSQAPDEYRGNGAMALAARQVAAHGIPLHAGETLDYLIVDADNTDRSRRVSISMLLEPGRGYDATAYTRLLRRALNTLLWPTGLQFNEDTPGPPIAQPPGGAINELELGA